MSPINFAFYDIECLPNHFRITFLDINASPEAIDAYIDADINKDEPARLRALEYINYKTFVISPEEDQRDELYNFMLGIILLVGFNNLKYDDLMIDYCMIAIRGSREPGCWISTDKLNNFLYDRTQAIIGNRNINYRWFDEVLKSYKHSYTSIDVLATVFETVEWKSLKQFSVNLKWYRVEDMPIHHTTYLTPEQSPKIFYYNFNDVLITRALYLNKKDVIASRVTMGEEFNLNLLNCNKSKIADRILIKFYSEYTGQKYWTFRDKRTIRQIIKFKDIINPKINFKTLELQKIHEELLNLKFNIGNKFERLILFHGKGYTLAQGGLHSVDRPKGYIVDGVNKIMRDADVESYYPNGVINEEVCPAHLAPAAFLAIARMITIGRIESKHLAKSLKKTDPILANKHQVRADTMKITANSGLFGKFGFAEGWLFDMKALYQVTINLQLYLLMLIEDLELNDIEVISANTDGITSIIKKGQEDLYNKICKNWMNYTHFNLEFNDYLKYWRTSVNDYLAIYTDITKEPKRKGEFLLEPELHKGWFAPIISKSVNNYLINGTPIMDTLLNHRDIYDFCISVKTGASYDKELHTITDGIFEIKNLSTTLRYYVSNKGGALLKRHSENDSTYNMLKHKLITPFNTYFRVGNFMDYDLNYKFYAQKASEIILKINGTYDKPSSSRVKTGRTRKGVKQIGNMFDED
jgi:hypothetical protein